MVSIAVLGAAGRMGSAILRIAGSDSGIKIAGAVESKDRIPLCPSSLRVVGDLNEIINDCDVVIDFTLPAVTMSILPLAVRSKKAVVIGTTGFSEDQKEIINKASKEIPVVWSPNMSMGVNVLFSLVAKAAKALPGYDVEIVELHHNQKKDAPSGTALQLAKVAAESLNRDINKAAVFGRHGANVLRKKEDIGIQSVRAGDIVGEHTVYFTGMGERIELIHRAQSRDTLATGAVCAAKWVSGKPKGLYDMKDVLGLEK